MEFKNGDLPHLTPQEAADRGFITHKDAFVFNMVGYNCMIMTTEMLQDQHIKQALLYHPNTDSLTDEEVEDWMHLYDILETMNLKELKEKLISRGMFFVIDEFSDVPYADPEWWNDYASDLTTDGIWNSSTTYSLVEKFKEAEQTYNSTSL